MSTLSEDHNWAITTLSTDGLDVSEMAAIDAAALEGQHDKFFQLLEDAFKNDHDATEQILERRHTQNSNAYRKSIRTRRLPMTIDRKVNAKKRRLDYAKNRGGIRRKKSVYNRRWNRRYGEATEKVGVPTDFAPTLETLMDRLKVDYVSEEGEGEIVLCIPEAFADTLFKFLDGEADGKELYEASKARRRMKHRGRAGVAVNKPGMFPSVKVNRSKLPIVSPAESVDDEPLVESVSKEERDEIIESLKTIPGVDTAVARRILESAATAVDDKTAKRAMESIAGILKTTVDTVDEDALQSSLAAPGGAFDSAVLLYLKVENPDDPTLCYDTNENTFFVAPLTEWSEQIEAEYATDVDEKFSKEEEDDDDDEDDDDEDDEDDDEPGEDDITTEDEKTWYQYGKVYVRGDRAAVKRAMDRDKFWPNVFVISDHGNSVLISDKKNWWKESTDESDPSMFEGLDDEQTIELLADLLDIKPEAFDEVDEAARKKLGKLMRSSRFKRPGLLASRRITGPGVKSIRRAGAGSSMVRKVTNPRESVEEVENELDESITDSGHFEIVREE